MSAEFADMASGRVTTLKGDSYTGDVDPVFKVRTSRNSRFKSGAQSPTTGVGSQIFVFGFEIPLVERFEYKTTIGTDDVVRSTVTITLAGPVEVEFLKET